MIREYEPWYGIPGHWLGGRTRWVATAYGWKRIQKIMRAFAYGRCEECHHVRETDVHHRHGRGGGKKDDRIFLPDGTRNLVNLCRPCHEKAKIQKRPRVTTDVSDVDVTFWVKLLEDAIERAQKAA